MYNILKENNLFNYSYYLLLFFLFFSGISISVSQSFLILASVLFIAGIITNRKKIASQLYINRLGLIQKSGLEIFIIPFIIISFFLAFLSPFVIKNLNYIRDFWLIFAFILTYTLHNSKDDIKKTIYVIIAILLIQSVISLIQLSFKISFVQGSNNIGIFHYNTVNDSIKIRGGLLGMHLVFSGYLMLITLPLVFAGTQIVKEFKNKIKWLLLIPVILAVIALIKTKSNSILIALPFSVIPLFFINKKSLRIILTSAVLLLILASGIFVIIKGKEETKKLLIENNYYSSHLQPRILIWKTAFSVFQKYPFFGAGGGNYLNEFKKVLNEHPEYNAGMITHAHNDYLNQLARKGIIGFLAFLFMLFGIFRHYVINLKTITDKFLKYLFLGLFSAFCVFIIAFNFQCYYTNETNLVMFWFTIGLSAAIVKIERNKKNNKMQIPFHKPFIQKTEIKSMAESVRSGWLTMGKKTGEFEDQFKSYLGSEEAIAVNSCTAALHLALICAGIKEGDEVIVPTMTHASTAEVVGYLNAKPVLSDIEHETHILDALKIEEKITERTRAIIPVHYAGQSADMNAIMSIAEKNNLLVIEDAAHAFPAKYENRYIGTIGHATCFSFYATKTITTGEGGMITTGNSQWAEKMKILRLHGVTRDAWIRENSNNFWEYDIIEPGLKYNTTDINSAMGIEQLKKADKMQKMREDIAQKYNEAFKDEESLIMYKIRENRETSWYLYPVKLNLESLSIDRNRFVNELKARGISASVHFIPLYRFTYYKNLGYDIKDYPESEWVFQRTFSLPIYPGMTDKEIDYVIDNVLDIVIKNKR